MAFYRCVPYTKKSDVELPPEYIRVKYLESSANQYIDPEIKASEIGEVHVTVAAIKYVSNNIYGLNGIFGLNNSGSDVKIWYNRGNEFSILFDTKVVAKYTDIEPYKIYELNVSGTKSTKPYHVFLFAVSVFPSLSPMFYSACRIYKFCVPGVANLIPVVRKSDNKPGMYDTVKMLFCANLGSGEFGYELMDGTYVAPI